MSARVELLQMHHHQLHTASAPELIHIQTIHQSHFANGRIWSDFAVHVKANAVNPVLTILRYQHHFQVPCADKPLGLQ